MKVTSLNPIYGTANVEEAVAFFNELGFTVKHSYQKDGFEVKTLENDCGLRMDIMNSDYVRNSKVNGFFATRLNVDNLEEAMAFFNKHGAKQIMPVIKEGESREVTNYLTENGDIYSVVHHIKD